MLKTLIKTLIQRLKNDDLTAYAAQITFYLILSLFPFLAFLGTLLSYVRLTNVEHLLRVLVNMRTFPQPVAELITNVFENLQLERYTSYPLYIW